MTSPSGEVPAGGTEQVTVAANYHQYYVHDAVELPDWGRLEHTTDGILAPLGTGVVVSTGARRVDLTVDVTFLSGPAPRPDDDVVAAECDVELPGGVVAIAGWSGATAPHRHEFGHPTRIRLRAEVHGRDLFSPDGPENDTRC